MKMGIVYMRSTVIHKGITTQGWMKNELKGDRRIKTAIEQV